MSFELAGKVVLDEEPSTLDRAFEDCVARHPDRVALRCGSEQLTYAQLDRNANQIANQLRARGVGANSIVGFCGERSLETVSALLGILKSGAAYLPLDPAYPDRRLAFMVQDSRASAVITKAHLAARFSSTGAPVILLDANRAEIERTDANPPRNASTSDSVAYVIYTSGSTGTPKGVEGLHRGALNRFRWMWRAYPFEAGEVCCQKTSLGFVDSVWEIFGPLLAGVPSIVIDRATQLDPAQLVRVLASGEVTRLVLVPSLLKVILETRRDLASTLPKLTWWICSGEALPCELVRQFRDALPDRRLINLYGSSEVAADVTVHEVPSSPSGPIVPIGRPIWNTTLYLLDEQRLPVAPGAVGELYVGGAGLARGYINQPALTAERFIDNPFARGALPSRLFKTGDLVRRLEDGQLAYVGRVDHQVKIRGHRVELGEVECVLSQHPSVQDAVVAVREDHPGQPQLVAYVVPRTADEDLAGLLRSFLEERLADYMVPSAFVSLTSLPLLPSGKVDRNALATQSPYRPAPPTIPASRPPRTPLEQRLFAMWQEVLPTEGLGVDDDFFKLGGDSLAAARLTARIEDVLGEVVYVVALYDCPTIARLAAYLEQRYPDTIHRMGSLAQPDSKTADGKPGALADGALDVMRALVPPLAPARLRPSPRRKNGRAIFILCPPRSGSTLLRVMLAGHPQLFAPPELKLMAFRSLGERREAFSGRNSLWLEGLIRAVMELRSCSVDAARASIEDLERRDCPTDELYGLLQRWIQPRTLVDKTPEYALSPATLERIEDEFEEPLYIHLLRHPHDMIESFVKARLDTIFLRAEHALPPRHLAELIWTLSHVNIGAFLKGIPSRRQHRIRFETLVTEPADTADRLCNFLGLPAHPGMLTPYAEPEAKMTTGLHAASKMIGDPRFHTHAKIDASVANRWQRAESAPALGEETWRVAEALGYPQATPAGRPSEVARIASADHAPLTFDQATLFRARSMPGVNVPMPKAYRVRGPLDVDALERSVNEIIARHEVLRTVFAESNGAPTQRVLPSLQISLRRTDLRSIAASAREAEAQQTVRRGMSWICDLGRPPLLTVDAIRLDEQDHVLLFCAHRIVMDNWSFENFFSELGAIYRVHLLDEPPTLPTLRTRVTALAAEEQRWLKTRDCARQRDYWTRCLADAPVETNLPQDRPRPQRETFHAAVRHLVLPAALVRSLQAICRQERASLFAGLLTTYRLSLFGLTGQKDAIIAFPASVRNHPNTEPLLGHFMNQLLLRTVVSEEMRGRDLLRQTWARATDGFEHRKFPLISAFGPEAAARTLRLRCNMPRYQPVPSLVGCEVTSVPVPMSTTPFDLALYFTERDGEVNVRARYKTDLFDDGTVERMLAHLRQVTQRFVESPAAAAGTLARRTAPDA